MQTCGNGKLKYLIFDSFKNYPRLRHAFSMRFGGVSEGFYASLNMGFHTGDEPAKITENFCRFARAIAVEPESLVSAALTHDANVRVVTTDDCGKGIFRPRDYEKTDALITNCRNVALTATFADCVPVFLFDPVMEAIGLVHSGWRGTVAGISANAVSAMIEHFGSNPQDILVGIGPHIQSCCFETGAEVHQQFMDAIASKPCFGAGSNRIPEQYDLLKNNWFHTSVHDHVKKYHIDLETIIITTLLQSGISINHIETSDFCTCCHPDLFFSHRATGGKRGCLAAIISL